LVIRSSQIAAATIRLPNAGAIHIRPSRGFAAGIGAGTGFAVGADATGIRLGVGACLDGAAAGAEETGTALDSTGVAAAFGATGRSEGGLDGTSTTEAEGTDAGTLACGGPTELATSCPGPAVVLCQIAHNAAPATRAKAITPPKTLRERPPRAEVLPQSVCTERSLVDPSSRSSIGAAPPESLKIRSTERADAGGANSERATASSATLWNRDEGSFSRHRETIA
jgi:hypothetical protein